MAVKVAEPDKPVPDTASVNVPLFTVAGVVQVGAAAPLDCNTCPEVPTAEKAVEPEPD